MWHHKAFNITFDDCASSQPQPQQEAPTLEDENMISEMLDNNKMSLLYDAFDIKHDEIEIDDSPIILSPKSTPLRIKENGNAATAKSLNSLLGYLKGSFCELLKNKYQEVYETFATRAKPLVNEVADNRLIIENIIETFVQRLILDLITLDKAAFKVEDMIEKVRELYYKRAGTFVVAFKNDFERYDYVNAMIHLRCREACDQASDKVYARCSQPKKRGRHNKQRPEEQINEIELITAEYIVPKKPAPVLVEGDEEQQQQQRGAPGWSHKPNTIDYYPIYNQTLQILNKTIPKTDNPGWYLERLIRYLRTLDSTVWPLHGLVSSLNNMNYCVFVKRVIVRFDKNKRRYYCAYSGLPIESGETVTWIKLVENDAERTALWRSQKILIGRPFEAPEFTRSIVSYYVKSQLCCPHSIFFTTFSERYRARFPDYFGEKKKSSPMTTTPTPTPTRKTKSQKEAEPEVKVVTKKPRRVRLDTKKIEPEPSLFSSLAPYASEHNQQVDVVLKPRPLLLLLVELSSALTSMSSKDKDEDRADLVALFDRMTEDNFDEELDLALYYFLISSPKDALSQKSSKEEKTKAVNELRAYLFDFVLALFNNASQLMQTLKIVNKNTMCRQLLLRVYKHSKESCDVRVSLTLFNNTNSQAERLEKAHLLDHFMRHHLLFITLFDYLVNHEAAQHLRVKSPHSEGHLALLLQ
jgi:hypothetical protein